MRATLTSRLLRFPFGLLGPIRLDEVGGDPPRLPRLSFQFGNPRLRAGQFLVGPPQFRDRHAPEATNYLHRHAVQPLHQDRPALWCLLRRWHQPVIRSPFTRIDQHTDPTFTCLIMLYTITHPAQSEQFHLGETVVPVVQRMLESLGTPDARGRYALRIRCSRAHRFRHKEKVLPQRGTWRQRLATSEFRRDRDVG